LPLKREYFQASRPIIIPSRLQFLDRDKRSGRKFQFKRPLHLNRFKGRLGKGLPFTKAEIIADRMIHKFKQ